MSMTAEQKARLEELLAEGVTLDDVTEIFGGGAALVASIEAGVVAPADVTPADDGNGSGTDPGNGPH